MGENTKQMLKLALIDDDYEFGYSFVEVAKKLGFEIDFYSSLLDLDPRDFPSNYVATLVDYHLQNEIKGTDAVKYLEALSGNAPVILISADDEIVSNNCDRHDYEFIPKNHGIPSILFKTATLAERL